MVEESFEYLDAPVERIAGADVCMPYAANLERLAVPQVCVSNPSSGSLDHAQLNKIHQKAMRSNCYCMFFLASA